MQENEPTAADVMFRSEWIENDTSKESQDNKNIDDDYSNYAYSKDAVSCMLFEEETYPYALAGKTGFQVWPGTRLAVDALLFPRSTDGSLLQAWQQKVMVQQQQQQQQQCNCNNKSNGNGNGGEALRVLELGAGVGVVGTSLAIMGAHVLLTDLADLVQESLYPNLVRNSNQFIRNHNNNNNNSSTHPRESWLHQEKSQTTSTSDLRAVLPMGKGWTAAADLDWNLPLEDQLSLQQCDVDLIIACDCIWLVSMLKGLFFTVQAIFDAAAVSETGRDVPKLLLSFQRRDADMFTTVDQVLEEIQSRGWSMKCLAWYPVIYKDEDNNESEDGCDAGTDKNEQNTETKEVFLFEISPSESTLL